MKHKGTIYWLQKSFGSLCDAKLPFQVVPSVSMHRPQPPPFVMPCVAHINLMMVMRKGTTAALLDQDRRNGNGISKRYSRYVSSDSTWKADEAKVGWSTVLAAPCDLSRPVRAPHTLSHTHTLGIAGERENKNIGFFVQLFLRAPIKNLCPLVRPDPVYAEKTQYSTRTCRRTSYLAPVFLLYRTLFAQHYAPVLRCMKQSTQKRKKK